MRRSECWRGRLFYGLLGVVYFSIFPYLHAINNPNENVRTYMTMAIVEQGTFRIDDVVARHGWVNDMARVADAETGQMHLFSVKAPAVSCLGVPVYWAFSHLAPRLGLAQPTIGSSAEHKAAWLRQATWTLRIFCVQLPCFLFLLWFGRFLSRFSKHQALRQLAVAALALGSNFLAYSLMFVSHALFAVAAFIAFALLTKPSDASSNTSEAGQSWTAGFAAGCCTLLEYHALPVSVVLAFASLKRFRLWRHRLVFALGAALPAAMLFYFQWRAFGHPLMPGHKMCENQAFAAKHQEGLFGIGMPDPQVMLALAFHPTFGLFSTAPFFLLGLAAMLASLRHKHPYRFALRLAMTLMATLLLTIAAANNWRGGWMIGHRFLCAAPPFFAFGSLVFLQACCARWPRWQRYVLGVATGLVLVGFVLLGFPSLHYNTLPESIARPTVDIAWPMARQGFVAHTLTEWLGWSHPAFWWVVVLSAAIAIVLPLVQRPWRSAWMALALSLALAGGLVCAHTMLTPENEVAAASVRHMLQQSWEPPPR